jgi:hypothetical protein
MSGVKGAVRFVDARDRVAADVRNAERRDNKVLLLARAHKVIEELKLVSPIGI